MTNLKLIKELNKNDFKQNLHVKCNVENLNKYFNDSD